MPRVISCRAVQLPGARLAGVDQANTQSEHLADVAVGAGERREVEVRVARENCPGAVTVEVEGLPAAVEVKPAVSLKLDKSCPPRKNRRSEPE